MRLHWWFACSHPRSLSCFYFPLIKLVFSPCRDKLSQKNAEHNSIVKKMAENAKADLQNKDMQLTDLQTKLCQVQQQLNEVRLANEMSSSQKCEEEVNNIIHRLLLPVYWYCFDRVLYVEIGTRCCRGTRTDCVNLL